MLCETQFLAVSRPAENQTVWFWPADVAGLTVVGGASRARDAMTQRLSQPESVNVLLSNANWAWPQAVTQIFQPRGINALMADSANDMLRIVSGSRIHLAILDLAFGGASGMQTLKMLRSQDQLLPCILLAQEVDERLLAEALALDVFSVLAKPVDLHLLAGQIDRLFSKYYASNMFSARPAAPEFYPAPPPEGRFTTVIRWTIGRSERSKNPNEDQTSGR
jgi:DNA-binding response OmpR family regulator